MNVSILEEGNTVIILRQLELFAVIDMLSAAAGSTSGRLSHDLAGFGSAIAEPISAKLSEAMEGITGKYEEPEKLIVFARQDGIDPVMDRIFRGEDEDADEANKPEKEQRFSKRKVLPDDN